MNLDLKKVTHLHEFVTKKDGEIDLPLDKSISEMTGREALSLLAGFKNIYFEEFWYKRTKLFLDIPADINVYSTNVQLDFFNKIAVLLGIKDFFTSLNFSLADECLFDDDVVLKPSMAKFKDGKNKTEKEYIIEGYQFWENKTNGFKFVLKYENDYLQFHIHDTNKKMLEDLLKKLNKFAKSRSVLKNKIIKLDGTIISMEKKYTWNDIVVPTHIKESIVDNVQQFFAKLSIYKKNKVACKRGIILHGSPGVGKTMLGKVLASQTKATFLWVTAQDVLSQDIRSVFNLARRLSPTIVFLEDMDFYAKRRGENGAQHILGELLAQLDGFEENHGVIVIGTTNDYDIIDSAISDRPNRFDIVLKIDKPDKKLREIMLKNKFKKHNCQNIDYKDLAKKTDQYSGSHIEELVTLSIIEAVKHNSLDDKNKIIILPEHIEKALVNINPSENKVMGLDMDAEDDEYSDSQNWS